MAKFISEYSEYHSIFTIINKEFEKLFKEKDCDHSERE